MITNELQTVTNTACNTNALPVTDKLKMLATKTNDSQQQQQKS